MENQEISIKFSNKINGDKQIKDYEKKLQSIYSLLSGIEKSQKVLDKSVKDVKELKEETDKTGKNIDKMTDQFNTVFNLKAMSIFLKNATGFFQKLTNMTQKSVSYVENINLLEVAYQNANEEIEESSKRIEDFVNKMAGIYGLDESDLSRKLGIFKQLANAMKLPTEQAENLSELMVKMTNDIASLYNLPLNRASNALQSALAGQVRPIRSATGADITEKTLQNTVDALGLDRSISQLSYVEKRLVMVISLTDQLKKSQGDYGRTIESASNQIRIFKEQWERLSRAIGNVFYPILERVLPYLNAILMVLTEIFNLIAGLLGFKMPKFDYSGLTAMDDATVDLIDGLDQAGESADNLKNKMSGLRGFDKLNVINTPTSSGASVSAGGGIDPRIMDAFNDSFSKYNDMMDQVNMKATKIRDAILDWLGFTDGSYKNLKLIAGTLGTIVGMKLLKGITGLITGTSKLGKLLGTGGIYTAIKKIITLAKEGVLADVIAGKVANLIIKLTKVGPALLGITSALSGTKGLNKQFKEMNTSMTKTATNTTKVIAGGALIGSTFGPIGAIIGTLAGAFVALETATIASDKALTELAKSQVFGTINISTQQFTDMLNNSGIAVEDLSVKFESFKSAISGLDSTFETSMNQLGLYGIKYGTLSQQISDEDLPKIVEAINTTAESATNIVDTTTDYLLTGMTDFFAKGSSLTEEEQANILKNIYDNGESQKTEIQDIQNKIIEIYSNAKAENRALNEQELIDVQNYLLRLRQLEIGEVEYTNNELDFMHKAFNDGSMKLDEESYKNWKTARDNFEKEQKEKIAKNYDIQKSMLDNALKNQTMTQEEHDKAVSDLYNQRINETSKLESAMKEYDTKMYQDLASTYAKIQNKTDDNSKRMKKTIEDVFKGAKIDKSEILNQFYSTGNQCALNFNSALNSGLQNSKISIPDASLTFPVKYQYANGGLPPVGQLFVANEKGPELVGQIGGQSFVANQNQMMDLLDRKLGSNSRPINLTIPVEVGGEKLATIVINDLQDMATTNGKPIVIGG